MARYEFIDHTADIAVKAYGKTLEEAFAAAAAAMFDIITRGSEIQPDEEIRISVKSIDIEGLLVTFLSELILRHEIDNWVLRDFDVTFENDKSLTATARGEKFNAERHGHGVQVKGVSYHMMEIVEGEGGHPCHVQVLFDI